VKVLVENGTYAMRNHGDIAMLQAGVARLRALWPEACFSVVTDRPERVKQFLPDARPILSQGHLAWFHDGSVFGKLWKVAPDLERELRLKHVAQIRPVVIARKKRRGVDVGPIHDYMDALAAADLVVCTGGGFLTDVFTYPASVFLDTLRIAHEMKKPTALLGQGIGPIATPRLRAILERALPAIDLITLREKRGGLEILRSLNYPEGNIVVTGDDAIELGYRERPEQIGDALGVNLRVAYYSEVDQPVVQAVREAIQEMARTHDATILPVPIAQYENGDGLNADSDMIRRLLAGFDDTSDGGASLQTPREVRRQAGRCRRTSRGV